MRQDEARKLKAGDVVVGPEGYEVVVEEYEFNPMDGIVTVTDRITGRRYPHTDLRPKQ